MHAKGCACGTPSDDGKGCGQNERTPAHVCPDCGRSWETVHKCHGPCTPAQIAEDEARVAHEKHFDCCCARRLTSDPACQRTSSAIDSALLAARWAAVNELIDTLMLNGYADARILRDRLLREWEESK